MTLRDPETSLPLAIAAVVRRADGRYLLIRRAPGVPAPGYWTPVTGRPEEGESLVETVLRECREEIGLDVQVGGEVYRCPTADGRWMLVWHEAWTIDAEAITLLESEVSEFRWLTAAEACALEPMFPATRAFFESARGV